jgi:hypothetical protein
MTAKMNCVDVPFSFIDGSGRIRRTSALVGMDAVLASAGAVKLVEEREIG